jgi:electron transport complex protein RnfG
VERGDRLPVLARALAVTALFLAAPAAGATVFMTQAQALEQAFPSAHIERHALVLTPGQVQAVQRRARVKLDTRLVTAYAAWRGDTLAGTGFFDSRTVRTMPGVFLVVVAPDTTVGRVDVLAFHEPPDYLPPPRWLGLFARHRLDDRLRPRGDIRNLSGASLTTRAVTESVRLALALYEIVAAPELAKGPSAAEGR